MSNYLILASSESDDEKDPAIFWTKLGFIFVVFFEAFISGMIPTWSESCRKSPKILGIANSFAGGIFLAIALMHIMPEMIETWNTLQGEPAKLFPLPELLIFIGYTFILIIDKVLFDSRALFNNDEVEGDDPAEKKFESNVKASMANVKAHAQNGDIHASRIEQKEGVDDAM